MSNEEKMALLEDMFEVDKGEISPETELESIDSWDSMMISRALRPFRISWTIWADECQDFNI